MRGLAAFPQRRYTLGRMGVSAAMVDNGGGPTLINRIFPVASPATSPSAITISPANPAPPDPNDPTTTITLPTQDFTVPIISPAASTAVTPIPTNGPLPPGAGYQQVEAPGNPFPYVYIGTGGSPYVAPTVLPTVPPSGSYAQTCQNIAIDANGNLVALCQTINGQLVQTSLPNWSLCTEDIANNNGQLQCGAVQTSLGPLPLPGQTIPALPAAAPASSSSGIGSALQFIQNNWIWFAIGGGALLFFGGRRR